MMVDSRSLNEILGAGNRTRALLLLVVFLLPQLSLAQTGMETVTFPALDGLTITADLYEVGDRSAPTVVAFHQSMSSRGEFREIAPRLVAMGINVLAVDLRWGATDKWQKVPNETALAYGTGRIIEAVEAGDRTEIWPTVFLAYDDMLSSVDWLSANEFNGPLLVVGSSFSAMLVLRLPQDRDVDAILSFSPGEYDENDTSLARRWAMSIEVPTLIVGAPDEKVLVTPIFDVLETPAHSLFITKEKGHGASLLDTSDGAWRVFRSFLAAYTKPVEVSFEASDGVTVFGDWYPTGREPDGAPSALLFHQGGSNARAEYAQTIPVLRLHGYAVLAVDLRSGGDRFGGENRTAAAYDGDEPGYCDAAADVYAAVDYLKSLADAPPVVFGSSFSAALAFQLAATRPEAATAVLAFSPASGEPMEGCRPEQYLPQMVRQMADSTSVPTLILRPAPELHFGSVGQQLQSFRDAGVPTYVAANGVHGSSMLNPRRVLGNTNVNWQAVLDFLARAN